MKIKPNQLGQELHKFLHPAYLVSGDEAVISLEAVASIIERAESVGHTEKIHSYLDQDKSLDVFIEQCTTKSLFSKKRILSLQLPSGKLAKKPAGKLAALIKLLDDQDILIISCPKIDKASQSAQWVTSINTTGVWVEVWPITGNQFSSWLHTRLRNYGTQINSDALTMLSEMCNGNLLAADQQAKKLSLLYPNKEITTEDLYKNGTDNSRFDLFQVIDYALKGEKKTLLHSFERVQQEGMAPSALLGNLSYQMRQLLTLSESRDNGENLNLASQKMRLWPARQDIYRQVLNRMKTSSLLLVLSFCSRVDQQIKGGKQTSDVEKSLLALLLLIAGSRTPQLDELRIET